jgi:hypothetical protein
VNQNGGLAPLPVTSVDWSFEISLDLDMVSAICPACNIVLVEANSEAVGDMYAADRTAVNLGARYVSNSFGSPEFSGQTTFDATTFNRPGIVWTASTGDDGWAGGPSYPATSPYVTAVGGTTLTPGGGPRGWTEAAWSGAGSSCSTVESPPSWQIEAGTACTRRANADVSAVADNLAVYDSFGLGGWNVAGGTSASAPIIAAVYALAGPPHDRHYPAAYPYAHPYTRPSALFDITSGSNGGCGSPLCDAGPGWDGPTGLGSPNGVAAFTPSPQWVNWAEQPFGGRTSAAPTATGFNNSLPVFVRGTDDRIYEQFYDGSTWSRWNELPGAGRTFGAPTVAMQNTTLRLFIRGNDNKIYLDSYGTAWSGWSAVPGGMLTSAAPSTAVLDGVLHLFIRGPGDVVYHNTLTGTNSWAGWAPVPVPGNTQTTPDAPATAIYNNTLHLLVRAPDNTIRDSVFDGTTWQPWFELPGAGGTLSAPAGTTVDGRLHVLVRGTDNTIFDNVFDGAGWTGWKHVPGGGLTIDAPGATTWNGDGWLFVRGTDNRIFATRLLT